MPADALFDRKMPVYVTAEQLAWVDDQMHAQRLRSRSDIIRQLIDQAREAIGDENLAERAAGEPPDIKPYSVESYPGLGMAPLIVPFLQREGRRFYFVTELCEACNLDPRTVDVGRKASIGLVMKACGFHPTRDTGPNGERAEGWRI